MTRTATVTAPPPRMTQIPVNLEVAKADAIRELSRKMRTPQQVFLREAVDFILQKYRKELAQ